MIVVVINYCLLGIIYLNYPFRVITDIFLALILGNMIKASYYPELSKEYILYEIFRLNYLIPSFICLEYPVQAIAALSVVLVACCMSFNAFHMYLDLASLTFRDFGIATLIVNEDLVCKLGG